GGADASVHGVGHGNERLASEEASDLEERQHADHVAVVPGHQVVRAMTVGSLDGTLPGRQVIRRPLVGGAHEGVPLDRVVTKLDDVHMPQPPRPSTSTLTMRAA